MSSSSRLTPASTTSTRAEEHLCPADCAKERTMASQACSGSADASTTSAFSPPVSATSRASGASRSAAIFASDRLMSAATLVEPTKETPAKTPEFTNADPAFSLIAPPCTASVTTLRESSSAPARFRTSTSAAAHIGVAGCGLITTGFPATNALLARPPTMANGKLNGPTHSHGPRGCARSAHDSPVTVRNVVGVVKVSLARRA
mmetsp:Transcript_14998/g.64262  ORF Transcript_14998/g.64262 Transcript_14998/m.64262 type:complete len:204 (+) Transcript_14998:728-1339(+)